MSDAFAKVNENMIRVDIQKQRVIDEIIKFDEETKELINNIDICIFDIINTGTYDEYVSSLVESRNRIAKAANKLSLIISDLDL